MLGECAFDDLRVAVTCVFEQVDPLPVIGLVKQPDLGFLIEGQRWCGDVGKNDGQSIHPVLEQHLARTNAVGSRGVLKRRVGLNRHAQHE